MEEISHFLEFFTKLLYGTHLSTAFSGVTFQRNKKEYCYLMILVMLLQNISYFCLGEAVTIQIYPILIHMPIILYLYKKLKVPFFHSTFSLILAFQLLSCRKWVGELFHYFMIDIVPNVNLSIVFCTFPLAFILGKYLAPPIAQLREEPKLMLIVTVVPITYYMFTVFTYALEFFAFSITVENMIALLKYIDAWFTIVFLLYILISLRIFEKIKKVDIDNAVLLRMHNHVEMELKRLHGQSEIEQMHRHDLRHHGNYILSILPTNTDKKVLEYIESVLISPETPQTLLSNNESLNLVLNSYKTQAKQSNIHFELQIGVEEYSGLSMIDLCSLLSNGLENAIKACKDLDVSKRRIFLKIKTQGQMLSIDLRNTFSKKPKFVNDLPISLEEKHGYGTKSMLRICEKYNGITRFYVVGDEFRFQTILQNQHTK